MKPKPAVKPARDPWALLAVAPVSLDEAIEHCAKAFGLTAQDLAKRQLSGPSDAAGRIAYQITCYVLRRVTGESLPTIGEALGGRDHSSIINAIKRVDARMVAEGADGTISRTVQRLIRELSTAEACEKGGRG